MKVKLTIPTSLNEILLKDYQKYLKIVKENEDAVDFLNLKLVEIFCKVKIKDVNAIRAKDFEDILNQLTKTFKEEQKFVQRFKINDIEYGFIPKLDDITQGEYVDVTSYISDPDNLHKAMAVLYRPIVFTKGDRYLIEDYKGSEEYADVMRFAPLNIVLGAQVFFYNLAKSLLTHTLDSLVGDQSLPLTVRQALAKSGDGITQFMHLLEGHSLESKKLQSEDYTNV